MHLEPKSFSLVESCGSRNIIILNGILSNSFNCVIVNVYGPWPTLDRRKLWHSLCNLKQTFTDPWCLGGDLNEVRNISERQGCSSRSNGMHDLNKFIDDMELD